MAVSRSTSLLSRCPQSRANIYPLVATDAPVKVVRLKVRCADEEQFKRELAARIAARLFVPTDLELAKDDLFSLHLKFNDGKVHVKGTARVVRKLETPKKGVQAKFVALEPDSIQFALDFAPFDDTGPLTGETFMPSTTGEHPVLPPPVRPSRGADAHATPAHGVEQAQLADATREFPQRDTAVYSEDERELVQRTTPAEKWSGGLMPLDVLGNYQLLERLGAGGMAEVYAARATLGSGVEKVVALKLVLPEFGPGTRYGGLFLNEAKISASLSHPALIQVFDFGEAGGRPYLAMEYMRGRDLTTVLRRMRGQGIKPPLAFAAHVVLEIVKALDYLHTRTDPDGRWLHLVHRDVSPGNILLSENGEVKLVDFGVAAAGTITAQHQLVAGKYSYMAPEQATGQAPLPSWDLYAAGVVLYELLTLQPLFEGNTAKESMRSARAERHRPPSELNPQVPPGLDKIVLTATHPDRAGRYSSAKQMREALEVEARKLGPADTGAIIRSLFGLDLAEEKKKLDASFLEARAARSAGAGSPAGGPLAQVRRRLAGTRLARAMARRPTLVRLLIALAVTLVVAGVYWGQQLNLSSRALEGHLERFDAQVASGALSGPGGDTALDHLVAARALAPADPRVRERSKGLAHVFEVLANKALERGDDAEAAVHLQALLLADPQMPGVAEKLKATEARVRDRSHAK